MTGNKQYLGLMLKLKLKPNLLKTEAEKNARKRQHPPPVVFSATPRPEEHKIKELPLERLSTQVRQESINREIRLSIDPKLSQLQSMTSPLIPTYLPVKVYSEIITLEVVLREPLEEANLRNKSKRARKGFKRRTEVKTANPLGKLPALK